MEIILLVCVDSCNLPGSIAYPRGMKTVRLIFSPMYICYYVKANHNALGDRKAHLLVLLRLPIKAR